MKLFYALVALLVCMLPTQSWSLEIYRNSTRYNLNISLPDGAAFHNDGVDRKFNIDGVEGNLRLIQDHYSHCLSLVEERARNWRKYGYSEASRDLGGKDCSIGMTNDAQGRRVSSFYVWLEICRCYAALHFSYDADDRPDFLRIYQPILTALRSNDSSRRESGDASRNADMCMTKDRFNCQPLSCDEQRRRGMMADWDEVNYCNLPRREKPGSDGATVAARPPSASDSSQRNGAARAAGGTGGTVGAGAGTAHGQADRNRNRLTLKFISKDPYDIQIGLYSETRRNHVWPGAGRAYSIPAFGEGRVDISCQQGEKICVGGWRRIGDLAYWGSGRNNRQKCTSCCYRCGGGGDTINLDRAPDPVYARQRESAPSSDYSGADLLGDLLGVAGAIAGGVAAGNAGRTTYSVPAPRAPRAPAQRKSGISGTTR